jgi:two-component system, OmpR family, response regulator
MKITETMVALANKQILVIDREPNMRQIVQTCLKTLGGWDVILAESGQEGLNKAEAAQPDAILLEGMITEMKLEDLFGQLQSNPKTQSIPIIFLTEKLSLTERHRFLALGAVGAISKPFDPLTLASQIAAILNWSLRMSPRGEECG